MSKARSTRRRTAQRLRRVRRLWTIGALAVVVTAFVAYLGWHDRWSATTTATGRPAPPFVLPDSEGRPVALADYLGHGPVVLVFYMTYGHCRDQLGKLRPAVRQFQSLGAEVMAISNDRGEDVRRMAAELGFELPVLSNPSLDVIYNYSMKVPNSTTADMGYVLIDRAGRIRIRRIDHRFGDHTDQMLQDVQLIMHAGPAVNGSRS